MSCNGNLFDVLPDPSGVLLVALVVLVKALLMRWEAENSDRHIL